MKASSVVAFLGLASGCTAGYISLDSGLPLPVWIRYDVPNEFNNPVGLARPTFRYWVPDAYVNDSVLAFDLKQMQMSGWGGVEVICLENYGIQIAVVDPAVYGYGGTEWSSKFTSMLHTAQELNLTVDFALGPTQGASIPILDPDSRGMNTELAYGMVNLMPNQSFGGALPPPIKTNAGYANAPDFYPPKINYTNNFVAAVVARKSKTPSSDPRVTQLDYSSVQIITHLAKDGNLTYTAPDDGREYVLLTYWQRRTGYLAAEGAFDNATTPNNPASWFAYVVDHFSQEGTDLWTSFTEKYVMNGENAGLIRLLGKYAWEDSAEFRATLFWTDSFETFFHASRGYSPIKAAASYFGTTGVPASTLPNGYFYFAFNDDSGNDISVKLRNDYRQVLQEMYETYHLDGLSKWAASWGLQGSVQPYATAPNLAPPWDMTSAAAHIDAPETESNYFDGVIDAVRAMGGGAMMGQKQIFSSELGAHRHEAYAITWPVILNDCKISYAGGVNRIVSHGYPYSGYRPQVAWPGLTTFEWTYSEMWGPRQPSWNHVKEFGDWIARNQIILQTGIPRVDVGIYRHKYISVDIKHYGMPENIFGDPSLANSGFSYVSVSPSNLLLNNAYVSDGLLASNGPGFSAFIVDNSTNITSEAVDRFLEYARVGFPILFVGIVPEMTPYYNPSCDASVKSRVQELLRYPSVRNLTSESDVVSALLELNITPTAQNLQPCSIIYVHRYDEPNGVDYFWAYNSDIYADHATEVLMKAHGVPYSLDSWSGQISPVLNYTVSGDRYKLWMRLRSNQTTIVAFAPRGFFPGATIPAVHVVSTDVQYLNLSVSGNQIIARDTVDVDHQVTLSNGTVFELKSTGRLPAPTVLQQWNLTVEDWQPGPNRTQNYTPVFTYHHFSLQQLIPWYNITGLQNTSGIGAYSTQFDWSPDPGTAGAYLDLGAIFMTMRLWINSRWTGPIDVQDAVVDISPYLVFGINDVKVEVSTTLRNRLIAVNVTQSWEQAKYSSTYGPQPYGLTGPVRLIPFLQKEIDI